MYRICFSDLMNFIFYLFQTRYRSFTRSFRRYPFHLFLLDLLNSKLWMFTLASTKFKHGILGAKRKHQYSCQIANEIIYNHWHVVAQPKIFPGYSYEHRTCSPRNPLPPQRPPLQWVQELHPNPHTHPKNACRQIQSQNSYYKACYIRGAELRPETSGF